MKMKQKCESVAAKTPIAIDLADGDLVSQVVREVLAKDLIKFKKEKNTCVS